jgi:Rrp15p
MSALKSNPAPSDEGEPGDFVAATLPAPLSSGAGRALGTVLKRLLDSSKDASNGIHVSRKRPRGELGLILAGDEDVANAAAEEQAETAKDRESRRVRLRFEGLGRVVPDAATGAVAEKEMRETATRGVLALFNAVAKAQKAASTDSGQTPGAAKKAEVVTRESFMEMIRAGVERPSKGEVEADRENKNGAKWMRDDYMTEGARKLKYWNREDVAKADSLGEGEESASEADGDGESDEGDRESDANDISSDDSGIHDEKESLSEDDGSES